MQTDRTRGYVELLVLAVMVGDEREPWWGYALIERMREISGGEIDLPEGTVYPALHRLEAAGCLASTRGVAHGRQRRYYSVTPTGRVLLVERRRDRRILNDFLADALAGRTTPRRVR